MAWIKRGRIFAPDGTRTWARHSALTPTPWLRDAGTIRVFAGLRDDKGVSRIGYADVDANDPSRVIRQSEQPVLDVGRPGTFDDNGVILGDIVEHDGTLFMYYVGFQLVEKVKFLAFTGLAASTDRGDSFQRVSETPVMDRSDEGLYFRAIHSVRVENGVWRVWYATGSEFSLINGNPYPSYLIRYQESKDGRTFAPSGRAVVGFEGREYRIGRPRVFRRNGRYEMYYTRGTLEGTYLAGLAASPDGRDWTRIDDELGITVSPPGDWDSKAFSYPSLIDVNGRTFMFYNGNDMGKTGFGYAEWIHHSA